MVHFERGQWGVSKTNVYETAKPELKPLVSRDGVSGHASL
jgi:hypothetical protein